MEMRVDNCGISACMSLTAPQGTNEFLNVNSPMQVGGTLTNLTHLASNLGWDHQPTNKGFVGCIRNMTFNGNVSDKKKRDKKYSELNSISFLLFRFRRTT